MSSYWLYNIIFINEKIKTTLIYNINRFYILYLSKTKKDLTNQFEYKLKKVIYSYYLFILIFKIEKAKNNLNIR